MRLKIDDLLFLIQKKLEKIKDKENEKNIWLAFSPIKQNPLNFIIQKGTELGVQKFIPILSERTIVKEINITRVKKLLWKLVNNPIEFQFQKLII